MSAHLVGVVHTVRGLVRGLAEVLAHLLREGAEERGGLLVDDTVGGVRGGCREREHAQHHGERREESGDELAHHHTPFGSRRKLAVPAGGTTYPMHANTYAHDKPYHPKLQ